MAPLISMSEVKKHTNAKSVWVIIHNDVYDLTKFLDEHPGGADSLLEVAGQDGTQGFEDVQHSQDARELMKKYKIGTLPENEQQNSSVSCPKLKECPTCSMTSGSPTNASSSHKALSPRRALSAHKVSSSHKAPSPDKSPSSPSIGRRVNTIIVPRESGGSGRNLKWAIVALAGAIVIGIALKKYFA